jgi:carbonic anhydrase/acetyltransferase-like protein (isoleucine patch superfamily)
MTDHLNGRLNAPVIHETAWVHPSAVVVGSVVLQAHASVWPTAVLRAEGDTITIGESSNIQDGSVVHVDEGFPVTVGAHVTVGHRAVLHGCTVEDDCLIGMGAIVLNGAVIGTGSVVGAGALVREGMIVPPHSLVLGMPGRVLREVDAEQLARMRKGNATYVALAKQHRDGVYGEA